MRYLTLLLLVACGGGHGGAAIDAGDGSGGSGSGSGDPDAASGAFCDGSPREVGPGIINGLAVDATGRLVGVGTSFMGGQGIFVGRWLATGEPDPQFGTDGIDRLTTAGLAEGNTVLVRADGTIVAGGGMVTAGELKPFLIALDDGGAPTGWTLSDPASPDTHVLQLAEQGTALLEGTTTTLRRVTAAGAFDAGFKDVTISGAVTATDSGLAAAVRQIDSFETYRLTPDGTNLNATAASVSIPKAWVVFAAMSHADAIAFLGATIDDTNHYHAILGRVRADDTFDTTAYPPNGIAELGELDARRATLRADGSVLVGVVPTGIVVVKPDGTIDRTLTVGGDVTKRNITSIADWNGHPTVAGTLAGGRAFIACF